MIVIHCARAHVSERIGFSSARFSLSPRAYIASDARLSPCLCARASESRNCVTGEIKSRIVLAPFSLSSTVTARVTLISHNSLN